MQSDGMGEDAVVPEERMGNPVAGKGDMLRLKKT